MMPLEKRQCVFISYLKPLEKGRVYVFIGSVFPFHWFNKGNVCNHMVLMLHYYHPLSFYILQRLSFFFLLNTNSSLYNLFASFMDLEYLAFL